MILDFVFIFLFLITCVTGFKRGFGAMALAFSAFILSIIASYFLYGVIYDFSVNSNYGKQIESNITEYISKKIDETADGSIEKLNLPVFIKKDIKQSDADNSSKTAAVKAVKVLSAVAVMFISYILARLIILIIKHIIHSVTSLPVINVADSLLGLVFGSLTGIIWCALLYFFVSYLTLIPDLKIVGEQYYSSVIVTVVSDFII